VDQSFYREPCAYRASLSNVKVIMMIIRVLMVELLCQAVIGQIPTLECKLPGTGGCLLFHLILSGIKWPRYPRTLALSPLVEY
jgi:hypothetical protein